MASAIAIVRFDVPGRAWLESAMLGPIYISQLVLALGWYVLYGPSGEGAHAEVEWVDLASLERVRDVIDGVASEWCA